MTSVDATTHIRSLAASCNVSHESWSEIASELSIRSIEDVERASHGQQFRRLVEDVPGVDPIDLQLRVQRTLGARAWGRTSFSLRDARRVATDVFSALQTEPSVLRLALAGSVRRMAPRVSSLELLVTGHDVAPVVRAFADLDFWTHVESAIEHSIRAISPIGLPVRLTALEEDPVRFFDALIRATGPRSFVAGHAAEHGIAQASLSSEEDRLVAWGLPGVAPECRDWPTLHPTEGMPVTMRDVKGLAVLQTSRGDGAFDESILVAQARVEGYCWTIVADRYDTPPHDEVDVLQMHAAETENARPFTTIRMEWVDIGEAGNPHFRSSRLPGIACIEEMKPQELRTLTERLRRACSHERVRVLALPYSFQLGAWRGWAPVLRACARHGVALGITADPGRYVPDEAWHRAAKQAGVGLLPMTVAYDMGTLDDALLSVGQARRGGWTSPQVIPTWSAPAVVSWLTGQAGSKP